MKTTDAAMEDDGGGRRSWEGREDEHGRRHDEGEGQGGGAGGTSFHDGEERGWPQCGGRYFLLIHNINVVVLYRVLFM